MMVNQMNNNSAPWPNTIPEQMPWLNASTCSAEAPMQFVGQQAYDSGQTLSDLTPSCPLQSQTINVDPSILPQTPLESQPNNQLINNPFCPQQASGIQLSRVSPVINRPIDDALSSSYGISAALNQTDPQQLVAMANFGNTLTQIPSQFSSTFEPVCHISNHKRNSFEMEDDLTTKEAPPTKQQLSENTLFQRFGSLNLSNELCPKDLVDKADADSEQLDDDEVRNSASPVIGVNNRKEFDRYVYLLFKDKNSNGHYPSATTSAVERLIREEREKLSKAVILWNPPHKNILIEEIDSDEEEEEFKYKDHRDFLKNPESSSMMMGDMENSTQIEEVSTTDPDDIMLE